MTQLYSQKYTVVCFFEVQEKYYEFYETNWPLHITILDTFNTQWPLDKLREELGKIADETIIFDALPDHKSMLGEDKDVPVMVLVRDEAMSALHDDLMRLEHDGSFVFNTPEFVGNGFLPHATDQDNGTIKVSKLYPLTSISLVDMFPSNDHTRRRVIETFVFKH